jgi:hypothetical protein
MTTDAPINGAEIHPQGPGQPADTTPPSYGAPGQMAYPPSGYAQPGYEQPQAPYGQQAPGASPYAAQPSAPQGYGSQPPFPMAGPYPQAHGFPQARAAGNGFSIAALILGCIAFLFLPIILGPVAIALAGVGKSKHESKSTAALAVAITGTVVGLILGAIVGMSVL